jgi:hypothetical protein
LTAPVGVEEYGANNIGRSVSSFALGNASLGKPHDFQWIASAGLQQDNVEVHVLAPRLSSSRCNRVP